MIRRLEKPAASGLHNLPVGSAKRKAHHKIPPHFLETSVVYAELDSLYHHLPVGVCLVDRELRYVRVNKRLAKLNGRAITAHLGRTVREMSGSVGDKLEPLLRKVIETGEPVLNVQLQQPRPKRENETCVVELCFYPIKDHKGHTTGVLAIIVDLSEREESLRHYAQDLEKRVAERTNTLQESVQSLEGVLYHVAHDLRAPLRAMQGLTTLLLEEYGPRFDDEGRDYAARIVAASSRMDALIRDLLAYGRLGHVELPLRQVDLRRVLDSVLDTLSEEIAARNAEIEVEQSFPMVCANEVVLQQVLINLISNAIKFVDPGVTPNVRIWAETHAGKVVVSVQDNGIGIQPEHQERIFRVFERLHRPEDYPGTGIGLAIVSKGVERMDGRVGVQSMPGKGTRFWVELPAPPCNKKMAAVSKTA